MPSLPPVVKTMLGDCMICMETILDCSVDCCFSDPPYGISYKSNLQQGNRRSGEQIKVRGENYFGSILNDEELPTEFLPLLYKKVKPGGALYLFCQWRKFGLLQLAVEKSGFSVKNMLVVNKSNHGMGDLKGQYAPKHELILFASKGRHVLDNSEGRGKDVFEGKVIFSGKHHFHPNEKPVGWIEPFLKRSCRRGGTVLDMFMGSGSTGVACCNLGLGFVGIEKDETYYRIACQRLGIISKG